MKKFLGLVCSFAFIFYGAITAHATTLGHWDYMIDGSFSNVAFEKKGDTGGLTIEDDYLTWGKKDSYLFGFLWNSNADERSSMEINTGSGSSTDDSATALTHVNNAIDASYKSLLGGTLNLSIDLQKVDGIDIDLDPFTYKIEFAFSETLNSRRDSSDIFYIVTDPFTTLTVDSFNLDGTQYTVYMDLINLEEYNYMGETYYGFSTKEGSFSTLDFAWEVGTSKFTSDQPSPSPEPATMLLMGMGLAGVGFMKRRRKK